MSYFLGALAFCFLMTLMVPTVYDVGRMTGNWRFVMGAHDLVCGVGLMDVGNAHGDGTGDAHGDADGEAQRDAHGEGTWQ